ncbi:hypothetical protein [Candidatus Poriferisocius sp.]
MERADEVDFHRKTNKHLAWGGVASTGAPTDGGSQGSALNAG